MNILDENVPPHEYQLLWRWGIAIRQIGMEIGHCGLISTLWKA